MATVYEKVKAIADEFGIPDYIWESVMMEESAGNPNAHANTSTEDSRGLFQINIKANPQYANKNLFDPEVNARIAFSDFINPVWQTIKNRSDLTAADKSAYVWKEGIRPQWTDAKNADIRALSEAISKADFTGSSQTDKTTSSPDKVTLLKSSWLTPEISFNKNTVWNIVINLSLLLIGIILLIMVLKSAFLQSVAKDLTPKEGVKTE